MMWDIVGGVLLMGAAIGFGIYLLLKEDWRRPAYVKTEEPDNGGVGRMWVKPKPEFHDQVQEWPDVFA